MEPQLPSGPVFIDNGTEIYRCGANGYTGNVSDNIPPLAFYDCGRYEGRYEVRSSGVRLSVKSTLKIWLITALVLALPLSVSAYDLIDTSGDGVSNVLKVGPGNDHQDALKVASQHGYDILNNTDHTYIGNITADYNSTTSLNKRLCQQYTFTKYQLAQQGEWNSPWYQISGCTMTEYDPDGGQEQLQWQYSYEWSIEAGPIGWDPISGLIGASWSRSVSKSDTKICNVPGYTVGCIWYQTKIKWFDAQYQQCHHNGCTGKTSCDAWSRYYHGNAPHKYDASDWKAINVGCSTGWDRCQC